MDTVWKTYIFIPQTDLNQILCSTISILISSWFQWWFQPEKLYTLFPTPAQRKPVRRARKKTPPIWAVCFYISQGVSWTWFNLSVFAQFIGVGNKSLFFEILWRVRSWYSLCLGYIFVCHTFLKSWLAFLICWHFRPPHYRVFCSFNNFSILMSQNSTLSYIWAWLFRIINSALLGRAAFL